MWGNKFTSNRNISNLNLTLLVELLCALAPLRQPHDGHHLGSQTGAPLLVAGQWCGVRPPAAGTLIQAVHRPRDAGGAHHVPGRRAKPAKAAHPAWAGHLHGAAEHHGPAGLQGRKVGAGLRRWRKKRQWCEGGGAASINERRLIKYRIIARLTAAAAHKGLRTPSWNFNHSLVFNYRTYCRGSRNDFLPRGRQNSKWKALKSLSDPQTEKTKNTKVSGWGQCRRQRTVRMS